MTVGRDHALIIEGLNAIKLLDHGSRAEAADRVVGVVADVDVDAVAEAAESVGARHTAAPLITALGGGSPSGPPSPGYEQWVQRGARNSGRDLVLDILRRAPGQAPRVVWEQLTLDPYFARFWAHTPTACPTAARSRSCGCGFGGRSSDAAETPAGAVRSCTRPRACPRSSRRPRCCPWPGR